MAPPRHALPGGSAVAKASLRAESSAFCVTRQSHVTSLRRQRILGFPPGLERFSDGCKHERQKGREGERGKRLRIEDRGSKIEEGRAFWKRMRSSIIYLLSSKNLPFTLFPSLPFGQRRAYTQVKNALIYRSWQTTAPDPSSNGARSSSSCLAPVYRPRSPRHCFDNHARPKFRSRSTVRSETPSASAVSSFVNPPK